MLIFMQEITNTRQNESFDLENAKLEEWKVNHHILTEIHFSLHFAGGPQTVWREPSQRLKSKSENRNDNKQDSDVRQTGLTLVWI